MAGFKLWDISQYFIDHLTAVITAKVMAAFLDVNLMMLSLALVKN